MSIAETEPTTETQQQVPYEIPKYDVRRASESYSNIAAVLAGFAFAAVILVVQIDPSSSSVANADAFRDWASIAFLVAFLGCILSAFTFGAVIGEDKLAERSHAMALLGAGGFCISANLIIWGLAILIEIFLSEQVFSFITYTFPFIMAISPIYLTFSALDPIIGFENRMPTTKEWITIFAIGFSPQVFAIFARYIVGSLSFRQISIIFNPIMILGLILMIFSAVSTIYVSSTKEARFHLSPLQSGVWTCCVGIVIGMLILAL